MKKNSLIVILLSFVINTISQTWSEPINISTMNGVNQTPGFAIDNEGNLHCVWAHVINNNYSHIYYAKSEDNGSTWTTPENISLNTEKRLINPNIVTDSEGKIYVAYDYNMGDPVHGKILMKIYDGVEWSMADTISGTMLNCSKNKLVIDHNDRIYCFWNTASVGGNYYYRYMENGVWSGNYHPYSLGGWFGLAFEKIVPDNEYNLHCLGSMFEGSIYFVYMKFDYDLNEWSEITQISDKTKGGGGADIDFDENDYVHFTWRYKTPVMSDTIADSTMYRYYNGFNWSPPELITTTVGLYAQKIQIINNKTYIINWEKYEEGGNIVLYEKENNSWVGENVVLIDGGINILKKSGNILNLIYSAKPDDDNLNIYYMHKAVDTATFVNEKNVNIEALNTYPNPFCFIINFDFHLKEACHTTIAIYSLNGELIKTIIDEEKSPGYYHYKWNGKNTSGNMLDKGIYLVRVKAGSSTISESVILQ